jgi:hypothetical protein
MACKGRSHFSGRMPLNNNNTQPVAFLIAFDDERVGAQTRLLQGAFMCTLTCPHVSCRCDFVLHGCV